MSSTSTVPKCHTEYGRLIQRIIYTVSHVTWEALDRLVASQSPHRALPEGTCRKGRCGSKPLWGCSLSILIPPPPVLRRLVHMCTGTGCWQAAVGATMQHRAANNMKTHTDVACRPCHQAVMPLSVTLAAQIASGVQSMSFWNRAVQASIQHWAAHALTATPCIVHRLCRQEAMLLSVTLAAQTASKTRRRGILGQSCSGQRAVSGGRSTPGGPPCPHTALVSRPETRCTR